MSIDNHSRVRSRPAHPETLTTSLDVEVTVARSAPRDTEVVGVAVASSGTVPRQIGLSRAALDEHGFRAKPGQTLMVPRSDGPTVVAVGIGDLDDVDGNRLRDAAAAFVRVAGTRRRLTTNLADVGTVDAATAAQAVVEGALLAAYRYVGLKNDTSGASVLERLTLTTAANRDKAATRGAERGRVTARAAGLARDLVNAPPAYLTARRMAELAVGLAADSGLDVEVFDRDQLEVMGCGGMVGVNKASAEPPRLIKLTYTPRRPKGHLAMVGKGIMYDSGGISIKPSDAFHQVMKMDMSGAAAVLAAMTALRSLRCPAKVTAFLVCTDNMPSGSAMKLGDVLTMRNGKTVEIHNTDAEGRLVLADGLSLAVEVQPDAIVDIATLTGAALGALGPEIAALLGTDDGFVGQVRAAAEACDEPVWQLPLEATRYRKLLDSVVADMKNIGGPYGGTITASILLSEFVGDVPWAHLDIAGPMKVDGDDGWKTKGGTGVGTRTLIDLATNFSVPASAEASDSAR
ncbi:MAG: leucyl aminopeptidase [Ilumatobacteraceae bacterium]